MVPPNNNASIISFFGIEEKHRRKYFLWHSDLLLLHSWMISILPVFNDISLPYSSEERRGSSQRLQTSKFEAREQEVWYYCRGGEGKAEQQQAQQQLAVATSVLVASVELCRSTYVGAREFIVCGGRVACVKNVRAIEGRGP